MRQALGYVLAELAQRPAAAETYSGRGISPCGHRRRLSNGVSVRPDACSTIGKGGGGREESDRTLTAESTEARNRTVFLRRALGAFVENRMRSRSSQPPSLAGALGPVFTASLRRPCKTAVPRHVVRKATSRRWRRAVRLGENSISSRAGRRPRIRCPPRCALPHPWRCRPLPYVALARGPLAAPRSRCDAAVR
jgi:hypothetical protein